mmetsp:Transcript_12586/g.35709  ORF Transcript_12586/g.35709 Transcript_12586/m.35709 type:complete len:213 (-) Transcript_12586:99-737(-)
MHYLVSLCTLFLYSLCSGRATHSLVPKHTVVGRSSSKIRTGYHLAAIKSGEEESSKVSDRDDDGDGNDEDDVSLEGFQRAKQKLEEENERTEKATKVEEVDGYFLRDVIYEKWGYCYDVDFNRVDSFGFRELYLNVLPFHLGGRRFRHETELDYLCHLQAVVEILQKYDQLDHILAQIEETKKKPRQGTVPIVAVPLRLDLTRKQVQEIIGY